MSDKEPRIHMHWTRTPSKEVLPPGEYQAQISSVEVERKEEISEEQYEIARRESVLSSFALVSAVRDALNSICLYDPSRAAWLTPLLTQLSQAMDLILSDVNNLEGELKEELLAYNELQGAHIRACAQIEVEKAGILDRDKLLTQQIGVIESFERQILELKAHAEDFQRDIESITKKCERKDAYLRNADSQKEALYARLNGIEEYLAKRKIKLPKKLQGLV